jgi:excisionase family DNA binding protein
VQGRGRLRAPTREGPKAAGPIRGDCALSDRLLTARELADYLGLSSATVLDWFERGDLPGFRLGGRKGGPVRFRLPEVEAVLEGWRVNGPSAEGVVSPTPRRPAREVVSQVSPAP